MDTPEEIERGRDEIRNDPTISSAVKKAMEYFWRRLDEIDAAKQSPKPN